MDQFDKPLRNGPYIGKYSEINMNWFFSIVRIAGAACPASSMLVQLQAEIDAGKIDDRLQKLETPIGALHEDINKISRLIYDEITLSDDLLVNLDKDIYRKYSRVLAVLESSSFIKGNHALNYGQFAKGLRVTDPTYVLYMSALFENQELMEIIYKKVDSCTPGQNLNGKLIKKEVNVPLPVIKAIFDIFEAKGYGICSRVIGSAVYIGKA